MRFKKGSKVEALSNKEAPFGAWRCAEIISGNGHTYSVRYDSSPCAKDEAVVERVPRKKIRPCPPQVDVDRWEAGELVEVLDDFSWKLATVLKVVGEKYYLVRLLGALGEFSVHKVNIRVRQSWQDERWFLIGKVSGSAKSSRMTGSDVYQKAQADGLLDISRGDYSSALLNNTGFQEPNVVSARILKRASPYYSSEYAESCTGNPRKIQKIEREGQRHQDPSASLQKVDAVAYPMGKTYMQASFNNHENGCCQMVRVKSNGFNECIRAGSSEANDWYDSDVCSVGSCSVISYDESKMPNRMLDGSSQDADSLSSDAESSCGHGEEGKWSHSFADDEAVTSHRFELDSYRSTLGKLFAYGPLSWEQEASLTDLRLSLNISDDEHLTELRNLISTGTRSHIC